MKILCVILSFYILALTLKPCNDLATHKDLPGITITSGQHVHEAHTCSPFCICQCCKVHIYPATCPDLSVFTESVSCISPFILRYTLTESAEFIIPPELS